MLEDVMHLAEGSCKHLSGRNEVQTQFCLTPILSSKTILPFPDTPSWELPPEDRVGRFIGKVFLAHGPPQRVLCLDPGSALTSIIILAPADECDCEEAGVLGRCNE